MHRIDAPGHASNLFTEGDPATSVPATVVSDNWLNDVQENIIKVIEAASITLTKDRKEDLFDALNVLYLGGIALNDFRLVKSGSDLTLERVTGNVINIDGKNFTISGSLPTLATTSLSVSTLYYIYAYDNGGPVALEASVTGYTAGASGRKEKTGDTTRRLVGMARTDNPLAWVDTEAKRFVRSAGNDSGLAGRNFFAVTRNTPSPTLVELSSSERVEFLVWAGETVEITTSGAMYNTGVVGSSVDLSIGIDSEVPQDTFARHEIGALTTGEWGPASSHLLKLGLAEGYHYATVLGATAPASTATFIGSGTPGNRTTIEVKI